MGILEALPPRAVGRYERLAYERHERDLALAAQPVGHPKGFYFDAEAGERAVVFIEHFCRHSQGEWRGQTIRLERWQKFWIREVFGWMRRDGTRRFRVAYLEIARKNGKTLLAAAIAAYLLIADGEPGAQVYSTATKEEQARLCWKDTADMVKQSPALLKHVSIMQKSLVVERTNSFYRPLGGDSTTQDGLNPHGHIADELHAHKGRGMWDIMATATGARRQPLTIGITTAGVYDPESIGWELHHHAQQVLDGSLEDDEFFAMIFAADEGDDWMDPRTWEKANPNIDVAIKRTYLESQCLSAKNKPSFVNTFLRLHLNVWTQQLTRWLSIDKWNAAPVRTQQLSDFAGRVAYLGVDLATKLDICALAIDVPEGDTHHFFWKFYVPQALVDERARENKHKPDYAAWVRDGWLIATPGSSVDYGFIKRDILALRQQLKIRQLAYDPWTAHHLMSELVGEGFSVDPDAKKEQLIEVRQGPRSLSEPSKTLESLVVDGKFTHGNNPIARWMADNVVIRRDANDNIAPDKRNASGKIDGIVAAIMALGRALLEPIAKPSVYETRGVRSF